MVKRWCLLLAVVLASMSVVASPTPAKNAQTTDGPRIGDPVERFDAAFGPRHIGQSYEGYDLDDGHIQFMRSSSGRVIWIEIRRYAFQYSSRIGSERDRFLPDDATYLWTSRGAALPDQSFELVEIWHSDSLASAFADDPVFSLGLILVTYGGSLGNSITLQIPSRAAVVGQILSIDGVVRDGPSPDATIILDLGYESTMGTIIGGPTMGQDGNLYYEVQLPDGTVGWVLL